jgi:hypothetical protein
MQTPSVRLHVNICGYSVSYLLSVAIFLLVLVNELAGEFR